MSARGFTLIELLVVVAIIGILAAIAIPQFAAYRIRGYNAAAQSDAKNIQTGEETFFSDNYSYLPAVLQTGPGNVGNTGLDSGATIPGGKLSKNVSVEIVVTGNSLTTSFFTIGASHRQGNRINYYESDEGRWKNRNKSSGSAQTDADVTAATSSIDVVPDGYN